MNLLLVWRSTTRGMLIVEVVALLPVAAGHARHRGLRSRSEGRRKRRGRHGGVNRLVTVVATRSGSKGCGEIRFVLLLPRAHGLVIKRRRRDGLADVAYDSLHLAHVDLDGRDVDVLATEFFDVGGKICP